jgi:uncharacterized protein YecE (DUF72 family)
MASTDRSVDPTAPSLFVGTSSLRGDIARYAKRFNLLEMSAEAGRHPKRAGLLDLRRSAGPDFAFSVVLPSALASLESGDETEGLIERAKSVAEALGAAWWVLRTPPNVTPSARSLRTFEAVVNKLEVAKRRIAWEPRGIWRDEEAAGAAASLGVTLVRDLLREDPISDDPVVYTRIRALGEGAHVGAAAAERIAERLAGATSAYVVIEGSGAVGAQKVLREVFGVHPSDTAEAEGDEDDEEEPLDDDRDGDDEEDSLE